MSESETIDVILKALSENFLHLAEGSLIRAHFASSELVALDECDSEALEVIAIRLARTLSHLTQRALDSRITLHLNECIRPRRVRRICRLEEVTQLIDVGARLDASDGLIDRHGVVDVRSLVARSDALRATTVTLR